MLHNPVNTAISFVILISIVGGSFYYVYALAPRGPWLGIGGGFLDPEISDLLGLDQDNGYLITRISPGSPAEKAGIQDGGENIVDIGGQRIPIDGDIIVTIDGIQINGIDDICGVLEQKEIGDFIRIGINRAGELREVNLTLEEAPPGERTLC